MVVAETHRHHNSASSSQNGQLLRGQAPLSQYMQYEKRHVAPTRRDGMMTTKSKAYLRPARERDSNRNEDHGTSKPRAIEDGGGNNKNNNKNEFVVKDCHFRTCPRPLAPMYVDNDLFPSSRVFLHIYPPHIVPYTASMLSLFSSRKHLAISRILAKLLTWSSSSPVSGPAYSHTVDYRQKEGCGLSPGRRTLSILRSSTLLYVIDL
ncbi:hypothetical protein EV421DRAFT_1413324 [Armillaria borealis]|uniref:Uncharacterized protein n=1 Tax=Armillaria borealis TaxID=47425 RepID=A0AA39JV89_9AGAR|nr:hypothetical protein EV421DRAFT_1413324 [Armillaria borealis]